MILHHGANPYMVSSLYGLLVKDKFNYDPFIFKIPYNSRFCLLSEWRNGSDHPTLLRFSNVAVGFISTQSPGMAVSMPTCVLRAE